MKITAISRVKGTRYKIDVDGEYWYILDAEIIAQFGFQPDCEVDEQTLLEARNTADRRRARERALYLLTSRDHSAGELLEKLSRNVSEEIALETVVHMQQLGLVNDEAYAEKLARYLLTVKRYGAFRTRQEMRKKHLADEFIDAALENALDEHDPCDAVRELIERKYLRYTGDRKGRQKIIAALTRLGHRYGDIRAVLEEYPLEEEQSEEELYF